MANVKDISVQKGKSVRRAPRRKKSSFISDTYSDEEVKSLLDFSGLVPRAWERELGRRLELAAIRLGKDNSVRLSGVSWKQFQRYFAGDSTVGASTLSALATATRLSLDYLVQGNVATTGDAELERMVVDRKIAAIDRILDSSPDDNLRRKADDLRNTFLKRSQALLEIVADGSGLDTKQIYGTGSKSPALPNGYGNSEQKLEDRSPVPSSAVELGTRFDAIDAEFLGLISDGITRIYREESARIASIDLGRLAGQILNKLVAAYEDPAERTIGLKLALEELRHDLRQAPAGDTSSSKRSA